MKRLFLTVVAVLSMTMTFAENEKLRQRLQHGREL